MDQLRNSYGNGANRTGWSEGFERVPLKQRLKLLLARHRASNDSELKSENRASVNIAVAVGGEKLNGHFDSKHRCDSEGQMILMLPYPDEERNSGELREYVNHGSLTQKRVDSCDFVSSVCTTPKVGSLGGSLLADDLVTVKIECDENLAKSDSANYMSTLSLAGIQAVTFESEMDKKYLDELDHLILKDRLKRLLTSKCLGMRLNILQGNLAGTIKEELIFGAQKHVFEDQVKETLAEIKIEQPTFDEFQTFNVPTASQMPFGNLFVKSEVQSAADEYEDELDHMLLRKRMKLISSRDGPRLDTNNSPQCMSTASRPAQFLKTRRPRKRQKTVTDSVETAMQEDAPELLKVLVDKGVSVHEIKLYGEPESTDALDDSSTYDNFAELEEVISKVFSQREALLKLGPLRCSIKGERARYCLECLFALVEQARYLQFRKWPVEWGWCRDLQAFIFVFERHNRIVLERPEYGYATYFFELEHSWPINWQIMRLVTAMKLTSCSRITLIENKALMVGEDLTEGEARVLMEYGWLPNTGLGTMLNYYDRVVHDRKHEDGSEWRLKIGKLLTDGYRGGTIVSTGEWEAMEVKQEPF